MQNKVSFASYERPTGGWGSLKSVAVNAVGQRAADTLPGLVKDHNKTGGYMCTSFAWAKPGKAHLAEFRENGAKPTFWDLTSKRTPDFFARHTVTELLSWSDYDLENEGRLTQPMRYNRVSDRYVAVNWDEAFANSDAAQSSLSGVGAEHTNSVCTVFVYRGSGGKAPGGVNEPYADCFAAGQL